MYNNPYGSPYPNDNNDKNNHTENGSTQREEGTNQSYSASEPQTTQTGGYTQSTNSYGTGSASGANPQGGYNSTGGSSYIWTSGTVTTAGETGNGPSSPSYYPQQPQKKRGKGGKNRTGLKVVAALMCCLIISFSSVGAFALMIQNGIVNISSSGDSGNAAFTINKVLKDDTTTAANMGTGVTELTPQQVAEKLIPSVVCIQTYNTTQNQQYMFGGYGGYGEDSDEYGDSDNSGSESLYSQGSGIIYTADGYIITNAHVISGATNIKVVTSDGLTYEAKVIGSDESTDLAVIKIEADGLTPAEFGSSEDLKVADEVMAIGNPGGIEFNSSVTMGYVSALDRQVESDTASGYSLACIQTDAAINPGNSGGALVNMYGQVVGINSSKIVATGYEGLGFAIPVDTAQPIITDLMDHGYVKDRAKLGVSGQYIDSMTAQFYGLTAGFYIREFNSQEAMSSELQQADVITAIDGTQVTSLSVVEEYLVNKSPGDTVQLTVNRASTGETLTIDLTLSENTGS